MLPIKEGIVVIFYAGKEHILIWMELLTITHLIERIYGRGYRYLRETKETYLEIRGQSIYLSENLSKKTRRF
jgi:hypothetical protein